LKRSCCISATLFVITDEVIASADYSECSERAYDYVNGADMK